MPSRASSPTRIRIEGSRLNPPVRSDLPAVALPGEQRVLEAAQRSLAERRGGLRGLWPFLGPAFIAAIAYVDPGNFATNIAAGSKYGYLLLWVILVSNLMAMLIQTMSAKLGIATGDNLAELSAERFSDPVRIFLWLQAEAVAMACDLAEFVGAALGFHLLFGLPLLPAGLLTGVVVFAILAAELRGVRHLEAVIAALVGVIVAGFAFQMFYADPDGSAVVKGLLTPQFAGSESVLLAAGILGATVMPHVIYLHSSLTQRRVVGADAERAQAHLPLRADRRRDRHDDRRARQHGDADHGRGRLPLARPDARSATSTRPTAGSARSSATTPTSSSASRCSPRASRPRASARSPARS